MYGRLVVVSHVWPGITPFNVFGLSLGEWVLFRRAADEWVAARNKREGG